MEASSFYGRPKLRHRTEDTELSDDEDMDSSDEYKISENSTHEDGSSDDATETQDGEMEILDQEETGGETAQTTNCVWHSVIQRQREHPFLGREGLLKYPVSSEPDGKIYPIDLYKLFVTDDIILHIVDETIRYADQIINGNVVTRKSRLNAWMPTNTKEMKKFIGLIICMGLVHKPKISLHWSKKSIYDYPFLYKHMSCDRFTELLRLIHFNDNSKQNVGNKLYKLQPPLDKLVGNFRSVYLLGPAVVIDKSLTPFHGQLHFRQYIPGKSHKCGVKLYKICSPDAHTWNLQVYAGKSNNVLSFNHSESIVLQLSQPLLKEGMTIYADNFYLLFGLQNTY
uniref:PiggyBac transposable element-derived protein 4-like isoform X2 n=1 Tax=Hirondellea gigas TaxID=1518452 RepID=A0A6A7G052_9CRUS